MKKFLCVLGFALCLATISNGQTAQEIEQIKSNTKVRELIDFSAQETAKFNARQLRLKLLKKVNNWPEKITGSSGSIRRLVDISPDGKPVYIEPLDSDGTITVRANSVYTGGSLGLQLHGENMTAAVFDPEPIMTSHIALENRAVIKDGANYVTGWNHGTGVAGQIIATDAYNADTIINGFNAGRAVGIAYKANVHGYSSLNDNGKASLAAADGLLVSNHSYGEYVTGPGIPASFYSETARNFDNIARLAPYYLSVWACGNNNNPTAYDRLSDYSTGKNSIAVANVREIANYTGPADVQRGASSRGPSDDRRIKPDISASGTRVRLLDTDASNNKYRLNSGTSFSAPTVAGATLLLQQHFKNRNGRFMMSATVKALMLHTALEAGPAPGPDISYGWGLLNVEAAAQAITGNGSNSAILEEHLANNNTFSRQIVAAGNEPLKAMIAWIDPPGGPCPASGCDNDTTAKLINDLDLRISKSDSTFLPWKLNEANVDSPALKGDNRRDNVEQVEINNPVPGQTYTLTVRHKGSIVNGQHFSLIITGLKDCVANRSIASRVDSSSRDYQQASISISANNLLATGGEAIYHAGEEIVLTDGFTANLGSAFRGYIEGCTAGYNLRNSAEDRQVVQYAPSNIQPDQAVLENQIAPAFPNPTNGVFNLNLGTSKTGQLEIFDSNGVRVKVQALKNEASPRVDLSNYGAGTYVVKVTLPEGVSTQKIVKK